jgi:hypothetical protein
MIPSQAHRSPTNTTETVTMDIQRYALLAASALLGFMLLGEWTRYSAEQDSAQRPQVPMVDAFAPSATISQAAPQDVAPSADILDPDLPASPDASLSAPEPLSTTDAGRAAAVRYRSHRRT